MHTRLLFASALSVCACGFDSLDHGPDAEDVGLAGGGGDGTGPGPLQDPPSNFPEPASTRCGALPDELAPIEGLSSGWLVVALPGATDSQGKLVPPGAGRLRLTNRPLFDCSAVFESDPALSDEEPQDPIDRAWGLGLTLTAGELSAATLHLEDLADPDAELAHDDRSFETQLVGTLELLAVTDRCLVGELRDLSLPRSGPAIYGGFIAEICERTCVPGSGQTCW